MTNLNNDTCELSLNELDAVKGAGAIVDAMHYAQVAGYLASVYSRPAGQFAAGLYSIPVSNVVV